LSESIIKRFMSNSWPNHERKTAPFFTIRKSVNTNYLEFISENLDRSAGLCRLQLQAPDGPPTFNWGE